MRLILNLFFLFSFALFSCNKSTTTPTPGNSGGNNAALTIASISPLNSYPGDPITITGTGFDTDITKDTVLLGITNNNVFGGQFAINLRRTKIISATPTQITFVTDSGLRVFPAQKIGLWVSVPSKRYFTPDNPLTIKNFLNFYLTSVDPYPVPCGQVFTGDSLFIRGDGFYKPCTVYIDGKIFPITFDSDNTKIGRGFLPITYFGVNSIPPGCNSSKQLEVKVINGDGKTLSINRYFYPGPNTQVLGVSLDAFAYTLSQTNNALLKFTGYAMQSMNLHINGIDNASGQHFTEDINVNMGGYPSEFVQTIDLLALPVPTSSNGADYTISFKNPADGSFGFPIASFTLYK